MRPISVVIMDNIMGIRPEEVFKIYDLKGSTFERINKNSTSPLSVLKDNNFIENYKDRVNVSEETKFSLLAIIQKDKEFLKSCYLMDYSLLLYFLKKIDIRDDESAFTARNINMSIVVKKGLDG